ncbi:MAG: hypothetical protein HAW58_05065, partial [Candidatus Thioglobus sp.]|nr:hypothetical protein [Candidatus Thioglobus sp.]
MNRLSNLVIIAFAALTLSSCGGGGGGVENTAGSGGGVASKGPFVAGAKVTAFALDNNGGRNRTVATTRTSGNLGVFEFANLAGGSTELEVFGKYLDENTGNTSTVAATLTAVVNVSAGFSNNINIATDIQARYIKALMAADNTFAAAKASATATVAPLFGLPADVDLGVLDLNNLTQNAAGSAQAQQHNLILLKASAVISASPNILVNLRAGAENNDIGKSAQGLKDLNAEIANLDRTQIEQIVTNIIELSSTPTTTISSTVTAIVDVAVALNQAPVFTTTFNDITTQEDIAPNDITISATDSGAFTITAEIADPTLASVSIDNNNSLSITPRLNQSGETVIVVTATDRENAANSEQFTLIITAVNDAPVGDQSAVEAVTLRENNPSGTNVANVVSYFSDEENDTLSYSISGGNSAGIFAINSADGEITTTINLDDAEVGDYTLIITAADSGGLTATISLSIAVENVNDAPVGRPTIGGVAFIGQAVNAEGITSITDADGIDSTSFTYEWRKNGRDILGSGSIQSLTTTNVSVGDSITVAVSFTDNNGTAETITSEPVIVAAVEITITSAATVIRASTLTLTATVTPSGGGGNSASDIVWSLRNNNNVASLNGNVLSGLNPGTVNVIATAADGATKQQAFTV